MPSALVHGAPPLAILALAACDADGGRVGESDAFRRYRRIHKDYPARQDAFPENRRLRDDARRMIGAMPDQRIEWLIRTGYLPLPAARAEIDDQASWSTAGSNRTRYAIPDEGCADPSRCTRLRRGSVRRICADRHFQVVDGAVSRIGRAARDLNPGIVGIVPIHLRDYRGRLRITPGRALPVTWQNQWSGTYRGPDSMDPLDDHIHRFHLRHLAGTACRQIVRWDGMADPPADPPVTAANRVSTLSAQRGI